MPTPLLPQALDLLRGHRSIRRFKDEPLPPLHIRQAVQAGQAASTSSAVQAYSLLQVTDPAVREQLVPLAGNQRMVATAPAFFVVCGDTRRHRVVAQDAGQPYDARLEAFLVAVVDASLFAQNLVVAFEALGYGACYVGGLRNELPQVDALLGLPAGVYPLFGLVVGVPDQDPLPRPRLPVEAVWMQDRYLPDDALRGLLAGYDQDYRAYLERRGAPPATWSQAMARAHAAPRRVHLAGFYRSKGADLD